MCSGAGAQYVRRQYAGAIRETTTRGSVCTAVLWGAVCTAEAQGCGMYGERARARYVRRAHEGEVCTQDKRRSSYLASRRRGVVPLGLLLGAAAAVVRARLL